MKETFQTEIQSFLISKAKLRRKWRRLIPTRKWFYLYLELNQRENNESLTKVRQGFVNEVLSLKFKSKIKDLVDGSTLYNKAFAKGSVTQDDIALLCIATLM